MGLLRFIVGKAVRRGICTASGHIWSRAFGDVEPMPRIIECAWCGKRVDLTTLLISEGPSTTERALRERLSRLSSVLDVRTSELATAQARIAALEHPTARTNHG